MTTKNRLVRFRDFLPANTLDTLTKSAAQDDAPLFSPASPQQAKYLLHTMFSPPCQLHEACEEERLGSPVFPFDSEYDKYSKDELAPSSCRLGSSRPAFRGITNLVTGAKSSSKNDNAFGRHGEQSGYDSKKHTIDPTMESVPASPARLHHNVSTVYVSPSHTALSSLAVSMDADLFSPSGSLKTTQSVAKTETSNTTTAFRALQNLEWLSFDFIASCESAAQLVRIATVLESCGQCPSLLRFARQRLDTLHGNNGAIHACNEQCNSVREEISGHYEATEGSSSLVMSEGSSSLVMSLSTTDAENEDDAYRNTSSYISAPSAAFSTHTDSSNRIGRGPSSTEKHLRGKVQRLMLIIEENGKQAAEKTPLLHEQHSDPLPSDHLGDNPTSSQNLLRSIEHLRAHNLRLQLEIKDRSAEYAKDLRTYARVEQELTSEIKRLEKLADATATEATKSAEEMFQSQLTMLRQLLTAAQDDRNDMVRAIQRALGRTEKVT
jgi:hypothetical protein